MQEKKVSKRFLLASYGFLCGMGFLYIQLQTPDRFKVHINIRK